MDYQQNHHCLVCGSDQLELSLSLGLAPLANNLLASPDSDYHRYPLGLQFCTQCSHGQLTALVNPEILFKNYNYVSGTNKTIMDYFAWFANEVKQKMGDDFSLLEIASNDGSLLKQFKKIGIDVLGVEPAMNIAEMANRDGIRTINEFWPCPDQLNGRKFDVITGHNVLAHTPYLNDFMAGVKATLNNDGIAIFQTSQANMLLNGEFDTIYHEHFSFFTAQSMATLCARHGLHLKHIALSNIHGTSFIFIITHDDNSKNYHDMFLSTPFAVDIVPLQRYFNDHDVRGIYQKFADNAQQKIASAKKIIADYKSKNYKIAMVGASAKGINFIHAGNIQPDFVIDETPLKIGKYIASTTALISDFSILENHQHDTLYFISPWNFKQELMAKCKANIKNHKASFLTCYPEINIEEHHV